MNGRDEKRVMRIFATFTISILIVMFIIIGTIALKWNDVYGQIEEFGEDVKLILINSSLVQKAYGEDITWQEIVILSNMYRDWDYIDNYDKIYIYDHECRHHQHYQTLDDYLKYRIWGVCDSYTSWYYADRDTCRTSDFEYEEDC